jgi:hypothetical protein
MQKIKILTVVAIVISILTSVYGYSDAFATHGTDTASCKNDGIHDGKIIHSAKDYMRCVETHTTMPTLKDVCQ